MHVSGAYRIQSIFTSSRSIIKILVLFERYGTVESRCRSSHSALGVSDGDLGNKS